MLETAKHLALYFAVMVPTFTILSLPPSPPTLAAAKVAAPWLVASVASVAAFLAALFDHRFVRRSFQLERLAKLRAHRLFVAAERYAKVAPFFTTFAFAALPIPFTIVRVLMPLSGYPIVRYAAAVALGRFPRIYVLAWAGTLLEIPLEWLVGLTVAGALAAGVAALVRRARKGSKSAAPPLGPTPPEPTSPRDEPGGGGGSR